ncbi:MAG: efflux RND transporter periplasmic adaptor subunit [Chthoniobacteraceae bacterium]
MPSTTATSPRTLSLALAALTMGAALRAADLPGLILPFREATLSTQVVGRVAQINFKDGDPVPADAIILELDKRAEEIEAARRKIIWELKAELETAAARVATVKHDYESTKSLGEKTRSVSKDELAKKALELRVAESEFEQISRREDIEKLEYEFAVEQVRRRELRAPHAGQIVEIVPKVGEVCEPRQPMVRFVDASQCYFVGNLDSTLGYEIKVAERLPITVSNGTGTIAVEGVVEFVSPVIDAATGLRRVKLLIDNKDGRVTPGSPATLALKPAK